MPAGSALTADQERLFRGAQLSPHCSELIEKTIMLEVSLSIKINNISKISSTQNLILLDEKSVKGQK